MRTRSDFPFRFTEVPHVAVPLSDGTVLSARLWLPEGAAAVPVPAVLEYIPYRKDDLTAWQDSTRHRYFAGNGYASVRVDLRGSGDSGGLLLGEYLQQELDDAVEVIAWIAEQPWCSGPVGMIGYSWGGFNGLQVAALRPPALKAVVTAYSTDDRYADDCHYQGGVLLGSDMLKWATWMRAYAALPPDPRIVGDRWREMWSERLEGTRHYLADWLAHQTRDDFWKHGSVCEDYGRIEAAVLAVGGWADAYTNAVPRLLEHLSAPCAGIIGPWGHILPERGVPGPPIGFLQECVAWWDRWLRPERVPAPLPPRLRVWIEEPVAPTRHHVDRPGRWIAADSWPPAVRERCWELSSDGALADVATGASGLLEARSDLWCGADAGVWCANGREDEMPDEQSDDDARSLCFDSAPLEERIEILGRPLVSLSLSSDRPIASVAVRLCDVAPDGVSTLLTWNLANLTHDAGHERVTPLQPGRATEVTVALNVIGRAVEAGHALRVAVSPAYWPHAWPSPEPVTLSVHTGHASTISIPVLDSAAAIPAAFGPAEIAEPIEYSEPSRGTRKRVIERNPVTGLQVIEDRESGEGRIAESGTLHRETAVDRWEVTKGDPLSARVSASREVVLEHDGWDTMLTVVTELSCDETAFHISDRIEASANGALFFERESDFSVPRDGG